jgi:hypothetical protein
LVHTPHQASGKARPRFEVADVFRASIESYRQTHVLTTEQERVVRDLLACRTAALGGHTDVCDDCGFERPAYNSCRNRHCPKCQGLAQALWLEQRKEYLLPVNYFHVVFTLPAELRPLALSNRRAVFSLLFQAASETLLALGRDKKRLGAELGFTAVLHTWTRDLSFHPHLHCIVTGGGLGPDREWVSLPTSRYLFPRDVIYTLFRGKFLDGLQRLYAKGKLSFSGGSASLADAEAFRSLKDTLHRKRWHVYAKPPFASAETVYRYLGRYTHRIGISNHRILDLDETTVRFRTREEKTAKLSHEEFIRRFLLHVLPTAFVKIRHYGLLASATAKTKHAQALQALGAAPKAQHSAGETEHVDPREKILALTGIDLIHCPRCKTGRMVWRPFLPEQEAEVSRPPPLAPTPA